MALGGFGEEVFAQEHPVNVGVSEGSIFGLILFLLYISDVRDDVVYNVAIYIDDTILSTLIVSRHQPIRPCMVYCCQVWASTRSCHLKMLDKLQKRIYMTVDPSFAASFEPLGHCQYVACLSLL